jgi:hypothetical protein
MLRACRQDRPVCVYMSNHSVPYIKERKHQKKKETPKVHATTHFRSSIFPFCCFRFVYHCAHFNIRSPCSLFLLKQSLSALVHALVHESEEADGAGADAHAVDEAAGEERAEDGAEVGVGDL